METAPSSKTKYERAGMSLSIARLNNRAKNIGNVERIGHKAAIAHASICDSILSDVMTLAKSNMKKRKTLTANMILKAVQSDKVYNRILRGSYDVNRKKRARTKKTSDDHQTVEGGGEEREVEAEPSVVVS